MLDLPSSPHHHCRWPVDLLSVGCLSPVKQPSSPMLPLPTHPYRPPHRLHHRTLLLPTRPHQRRPINPTPRLLPLPPSPPPLSSALPSTATFRPPTTRLSALSYTLSMRLYTCKVCILHQPDRWFASHDLARLVLHSVSSWQYKPTVSSLHC